MNPNLILIAGAGSGIGLHLAKTLLKKGYELLLLDLNRISLEQNFQESQSLRILGGDVSKPETWFEAVEIAKELGRPISHLFNCAGVIRPGFVKDFDLSDIDFHLDINTKGSILGTKIIGAEMKNQEFGHIINYPRWLDYPEETKLTFSGSKKVLQPEDVTRVLLKLCVFA